MADGNRVVQLLEAGLRASAMRSKTIANNLANIETPGYRRKDVRFEDLLAGAINSSGEIDLSKVTAEIYEPMTTPVDSRGNDVSMDSEIGQMIKNGAAYKAYVRLLNRTYKQMELAMGR